MTTTVAEQPSTFEFARNLLASSPTFRQQVLAPTLGSEPTEEQARDYIYREETLLEAEQDNAEESPDQKPLNDRPLGLINSQSDTRELIGTAVYAGQGTLYVTIELPIPQEYQFHVSDTDADKREKFAARNQWVRNLFNSIRLEMQTRSGQSDGQGNLYLNMIRCDELQPPRESEDEEQDRYFGWAYELEWR